MFLPLWHAKPQTVIEDGEKVRQLKVENEFKNSQSAPPLVITTDETLRYTNKLISLQFCLWCYFSLHSLVPQYFLYLSTVMITWPSLDQLLTLLLTLFLKWLDFIFLTKKWLGFY
jgi:hypothetical protein